MEECVFDYRQRLRISGRVKQKFPLDDESKSYFSDYGINSSVVKYPLQKVIVNTTLGDHSGIGCLNEKGGVEFFAKRISADTMTVGNYGLIVFKASTKKKMRECYLLSNILDYLSLRTLQFEGYIAAKYPGFADYIVLNDSKNVLPFICESDSYDIIHCMLPNTDAGLILSQTLKVRNPNHIIDDSELYSEFKSLTEYLVNIKKQEKNYENK